MAINVKLAESKSAWGRGAFEDARIGIEDGPYFYLWPEIDELREKYGKFIDLCGDVFFEPHTIEPLLSFLRRGRDRAMKMAKEESVISGIEQETKREVRIKVQREQVQNLIGALIDVAERAKAEKKYLIFLGD